MRLIFLFILTISSLASAATLVSETVGQVSDRVVTSREVQISMAIGSVLFPDEKGNAQDELRPGLAQFSKAVTQVLLELVVVLEAENFNVATVSEVDLKEALAKVEKGLSGKSLWNRIEPSAAEIKNITSRKLIAKSFLKFKTNSMAGIITDQEALAYYNENRAKFGNSSFEDFRENIKTFLAQQQLEERLRSWFEVIKRKYKVRSLVADSYAH